ncbi:MAG: peptidyl-prolyl cis-trans isomerase [Acidobacteriota bacterium]|nr:MAG: peptidyl-prolyl cis-trans isomerase [Acidobacteriota bacterium]
MTIVRGVEHRLASSPGLPLSLAFTVIAALTLLAAGPLVADVPVTTKLDEPSGEAVKTPPPDEQPARLVGSVNGEPITLSRLEQRLEAMHSEVQQAERRDFDPDKLLFRVVNDMLLAQEARALEMEQEEEIRAQVARLRDELMVKALSADEVEGKATASEDETRAAFQQEYTRFTVRVLTVDDQQQAKDLRGRIEGGEQLADLAKKLSVDPYAPRGGLLESVVRRDLAPEVAQLVETAQAGQLLGPVLTDLGWTLIHIEKIEDADPEQLESVRRQIGQLVAMEKARALRKGLAERARSSHPVEIVPSVVDRLVPKRLPDGRLAPEIADEKAVAVRVGDGGISITAGEYARALLKRWSRVRGEQAARRAAPIVLSRMIEDKLLLAEAQQLGYAEKPAIIAALSAFEDQLLVQKYLEEVVASGIEIDPQSMRAYYEQHKEAFRRPARLHLAQVTVETSDQAEKMRELLANGADIAWLAKEHSIDRFAGKGGDRGWMVPEPGVDEFNDSLMTAQPGDVLQPLRVPGNYVVMQVTAREEQGEYSFNEVSGNIRNAMFSEAFQKKLDEVITKLRSLSEIEIDEEALTALVIGGSVDEKASGESSSAHGH